MPLPVKRITDIDVGCLGPGVGITGSPNVFSNYLNNQRIGDLCVGPGVGVCITGSPDVFTNDIPQHRVTDTVIYFCGPHVSITGSPNVFAD